MTDEFRHCFEIVERLCQGHMTCMRVCPTRAIRVRNGKIALISERCIDCGQCGSVCPTGAIRPKTASLSELADYDYSVAIPTPTLFGQFPMDVKPIDIVEGLLALGFDAVYDGRAEFELVNRAIADYLDESKGPYPLISSFCPVIVRLVQVSYPHLLDQIIPIDSPREIIAREMKQRYSEELGLPPERIAAVYIAPCCGKAASILHPAEGVKSYMDQAVGISEIYNPLRAALARLHRGGRPPEDYGFEKAGLNQTSIGWAMTGGQSTSLKRTRFLSVARLDNIIHVFDNIEKGKIKGIEFLECYACTGGCVGGGLTVDNTYVARAKLQRLASLLPDSNEELRAEVDRRYKKGEYFIRAPLQPRHMEREDVNLQERIRRIKTKERVEKLLPHFNCGLCGSPDCATFAEDVAAGEVTVDACIGLSNRRVEELRRIYKVNSCPILGVEETDEADLSAESV